MRQNFNKLGYREEIESLKISPHNRREINKFLEMISDRHPTRLQKYRNALTRFAWLIEKNFDKLSVQEGIKANSIINKGNLSVKTKKDVISEIKTFYKAMYGEDIEVPKCVKVMKAPKQRGKLRLPEELPDQEFINQSIKASNNDRDKFYISLVGQDSGIRPIEARNIKLKHIKKDKHGYYITIYTAKDSGNSETRIIRIIKSLPYYEKWINSYPGKKDGENYLFINYSDHKQLSQAVLTALFQRLRVKLKWKYKLNSYTLRHTFITEQSKNPQWSIPLLKKFIGHSLASNVISEYQHFNNDDVQNMQLKINGIIQDKKEFKQEFKPAVCHKCKKSNPPHYEFCDYCHSELSPIKLVESNEGLKKDIERLKKESNTQKKILENIAFTLDNLSKMGNKEEILKVLKKGIV